MKAIATTVLAAFLLVACATTPPVPAPILKTTLQSEKNANLIDLKVVPRWQGATFLSTDGFSGFSVTMKNVTDNVVRVVWEKSSVSFNGNSFPLFITGQKYLEATNPMPPMSIPTKGFVEKDVFSSSQPRFQSGRYGGWTMDPIPAREVVIVLCVQSGTVEDYLTIHVGE